MIKALWGISTGTAVYKPGDIVPDLPAFTEEELVAKGQAEWVAQKARKPRSQEAEKPEAGESGKPRAERPGPAGSSGDAHDAGSVVEMVQWVKRGDEELLVKDSEMEDGDEIIPLSEELTGKQLDSYGAAIGVDTTKKSAKADKFELISEREFDVLVAIGKAAAGKDEIERIETMSAENLDAFGDELGYDGELADIDGLDDKRAQIFYTLGLNARAESMKIAALAGVDDSLK